MVDCLCSTCVCISIMCVHCREIFMEKHWSSVVSRSVCDYFFEAQSKATSAADLPPVISTPHYHLVSIFRNHLYFVAVLQSEGTCVCVVAGWVVRYNYTFYFYISLLCSLPPSPSLYVSHSLPSFSLSLSSSLSLPSFSLSLPSFSVVRVCRANS